ncbi:hypothetical protein K402DRAFT_184162 [Aulographum hederae CBS 113979]|uniref:Uncharacterized protein n=1 Tax=Aulographum hederae CBS 113979 TaxID=1176131 RepID=A0A6G1GPU6_9PEZI|nr:hypothetical protein K402DRAFT_184162 [Aulographum hederae CBS 113979]
MPDRRSPSIPLFRTGRSRQVAGARSALQGAADLFLEGVGSTAVPVYNFTRVRPVSRANSPVLVLLPFLFIFINVHLRPRDLPRRAPCRCIIHLLWEATTYIPLTLPLTFAARSSPTTLAEYLELILVLFSLFSFLPKTCASPSIAADSVHIFVPQHIPNFKHQLFPSHLSP